MISQSDINQEEKSMTIDKKREGEEFTLKVSGRMDTMTSPEVEKVLKSELADAKTLVFDFSDLEYISSAGLRVLLSAQKVMSRQGKMVVRNVNDTVMDVFTVTGFSDILTIE